MDFQRLEEWLAWLERERPSTNIRLGLENLWPIVQQLQLGQFDCKVVTVAGTNGKGSCVATLESIAVAAGLNVATYTSPHLEHFCERLRVQGKPVSEEICCLAFANFAAQLNPTQINTLSYFEWITMAALYYFSTLDLDLLILEVGLGGRLDAVNVVRNDMSVITSLGLDHQDYLGDTLEEIASEKAGIIHPNTVVISTAQTCREIIAKRAKEQTCTFLQLGQDFALQTGAYAEVWPSLPSESVSAAIQCCYVLQDSLHITPKAIQLGLSRVHLPGRFEQIEANGRWILDVGHNPAAVEWLVDKLKSAGIHQTPMHIIFGVCADKSWPLMLSELCQCKEFTIYWYTTPIPTPRSVAAQKLSGYLTNYGQQVQTCKSVQEACDAASKNRSSNETIIVLGSFFTVAEVKQYIDTCIENAQH